MSTWTPREREVAALVARGLRNQEIARRLGVTLATVKTHVTSLLWKARLQNRTALALYVVGAAGE